METIKQVPGHLVLGNLSDFRKDSMAFLSRIAETESALIRFRLLHMDCYLLNSLAGVNHVLCTTTKTTTRADCPSR
jgi:hypothetical protein